MAYDNLDSPTTGQKRPATQMPGLPPDASQIARPQPSGAFSAGRDVRAAIGNAADIAAGTLTAAGNAITRPAVSAARGVTEFGRGLFGGSPDTPPTAAAPPVTPVAAGATGSGGGAGTTPSIKPVVNPTVSQLDSAGALRTSAADAAQKSTAPGTAVINGRVLSPTEIADAGNRVNVVNGANFSRPAPGTALSAASGGAYTPESGSALTRPTPTPGAAGAYDPTADIARAQTQAQSDINSILSKDPRSALGITARNLSLDLSSQSHPSRYGGGGVSPYAQAIDELIGSVKAGQSAATTAALDKFKGQGESEREAARNAVNMYDASLRRPEPKPIQLEDGTLAQYDANGIARPITDAQGKPIKQMVQKENAEGKLSEEVAKTAASLFQNSQLTKTPLTIDQAREQALQLHGQTAQQAKPSKADFLKAASAANPGAKQADLEKFYNQKYGT